MKRIWLLVVFSLAYSSTATSQRTAAVRLGDQVRFKSTTNASVNGTELNCEAKVSRMMLDTLVLVPFGHCRRYTDLRDIRDLEVAHDQGSRRKHFIKGLTFGAIGGALAGFLIAGDGCSQSPCDDGGLAVIEFTFGGAVTGGITGGVLGILLPAGTRWKAVPRQLVRLDGR